jgi:hypothetical protein
MTSVMLVTVSAGLTPDQLGFGQPAACPETIGGAVKTAGFVVIERLPFSIALAGKEVEDVAGPIKTLFCPGAVLPPAFCLKAAPQIIAARLYPPLPSRTIVISPVVWSMVA